MDRRRVDAAATPFLTRAFDTYCWAELQNLPSNALLPTMLTGVYPQQHGVWGVRLRAEANGGKSPRRWIDFLPDLVTTLVQCAAHLLTGERDLPAIPPCRRRQFEITRTRYVRRKRPHEVLGAINDFHHPLADLWLGLTDSKQLPRVVDPRQRANHGYLPHYECERGVMLVLDHGWRALQSRMTLIDVAPSILSMLGAYPSAASDLGYLI